MTNTATDPKKAMEDVLYKEYQERLEKTFPNDGVETALKALVSQAFAIKKFKGESSVQCLVEKMAAIESNVEKAVCKEGNEKVFYHNRVVFYQAMFMYKSKDYKAKFLDACEAYLKKLGKPLLNTHLDDDFAFDKEFNSSDIENRGDEIKSLFAEYQKKTNPDFNDAENAQNIDQVAVETLFGSLPILYIATECMKILSMGQHIEVDTDIFN